jgi:hypothetical protein
MLFAAWSLLKTDDDAAGLRGPALQGRGMIISFAAQHRNR